MSETKTIPGYYVWSESGKAVSVQMNLDLIDRLSTVVMTGFGAIPRRGAEVGGILIGTIAQDVVRIDEFEAVPCSYKRGPSYLLTEADSAAFDEAFEKWKPGPGKEQYAVGYYRSNTRDLATVADEDRALCEKYFPAPANVMLFIKPYASKVSTAGFITYDGGRLEDETAREFPFRRYEIEGTAAPARRPLGESRAARSGPEPRLPRRAIEPARVEESAVTAPPPPAFHTPAPAARAADAEDFETAPLPRFERQYAGTAESQSARRRSWAWVPLSSLFLLLGVLLGFEAAPTMFPNRSASSPQEDPYIISLAVTQSGENLHVKWSREARAVRAADRAVLYIRDGSYTKQVDLDVTQLQNGSVIYRRLSDRVHFRFEVFPRERVSVAEAVDWAK